MTTFLLLKSVCMHCHEIKSVSVEEEGYNRWVKGALIQDALPDLPIEDAELLISGTCNTCWNKYFGTKEQHHDRESTEIEAIK